MALLSDQLNPTVGTPQPVVLQPRQRLRMNLPQFYQQQQSQPQDQQQQPSYVTPLQQDSQIRAQEPTTQDFLVQQFQKLSQRPAVPELNPGSRVQSPNMQLVQPDNFQTFYDRLGAIKQSNDAMLAAAQSKAAYTRMQSLQSSLSPLGGGSTGGSGGSSAPSVPSNPKANFQYAQNIAANYGWNNSAQLNAWYQIGMNESGWNNNAQNPHSTAYGIGQFLDSTWGGYGIPKTSNPQLQVEAMARYIKARYGSPVQALAFWNAHHWY